MKKFQALFLISFLVALPLQAQTYHAGEKTVVSSTHRNWVEFSVAGARSFSRLEDGGGYTQLSHQDGLSGRGLIIVYPWLALGVEGTSFGNEKSIPYVSHFKQSRYGVVGKLTLTPDTQPKVYVLIGAGKTKRKFEYEFSFTEETKTNYMMAAIGIEIALWKEIFIAAEAYGVYNGHRHISRFFEQNHRFEPGLMGRLGIRF